MKKIILFAMFICMLKIATASGSNSILQQSYNNFRRKPSDRAEHCRQPGLTCKSCSELIKCIELEPGKFEENLIQTCSSDKTCLINSCSTDPNPKCYGSPPFTCTATGTFPDPYDCQIYHVCIRPEDIVIPEGTSSFPAEVHEPVKCQGDYGYNYETTLCDLYLERGNCPSTPPVSACLSLGQSQPLGTSSYYYVCVDNGQGRLRAIMHVCPHGTMLLPSGKCGIKAGHFISEIMKHKYEAKLLPYLL